MTTDIEESQSLEELINMLPRESFLDSQILFEDSRYDGAKAPHRMVLPSRRSIHQMIKALELSDQDRVLHIGTGFGFTTLVLSLRSKEVISLERLHHRAHFAREKLALFDRENISVIETEALDHEAIQGPFQAILVETADGKISDALLELLAPQGRLVALAGSTGLSQQLVRYRRAANGELHREELGEFQLTPSIEEILVDLGITDREKAAQIRRLSKTQRISITNALMQKSDLDELEIYRALALQRGLRLSTTRELIDQIEQAALDRIPRPFMKHNQFVPIHCRQGKFLVATPDPDADVAILKGAANCDTVQSILVTPTDYRRLWRAIELEQFADYEPKGFAVKEAPAIEEPADLQDLAAPEQSARIASIFDGILVDAVAERASDIHFERYDNRVRIRFRIDGDCVDMPRYQITPAELAGIINVIKIGSNLDIAERRLPQGGRMERKVGGHLFDLRVQTQPAHHGEYVVIRILPRDNRMITIKELGFPDELAQDYKRLLISPSGLVLVVGPTGSGKSTTLYAGLQLLADDKTRKVITVEDPVEYSIDNVQQTQVKSRIGFNFANAMRSFVRQDPDVILVGEIRDDETALEAIRASQTGHLVLSTLHSNDAVDAIQRLFDLGMQANSIASELIAVIAQRLARRICPHCSEEVAPDPSIAAEVFPTGIPDDFVCYSGRGCSRCDGRGVRGRIAVIELLKVTAPIRQAVAQQLQVDELRSRCLSAGLYTMRRTALDLVRQGIIPMEELRRILPEERMGPEVIETQ